MRIDEIININTEDALIEQLAHGFARIAVEQYRSMEIDSNNFSLGASHIYSQDEIANFIYTTSIMKSQLIEAGITTGQSMDIIDDLITYLKAK